MIQIKHYGSFRKTTTFLRQLIKVDYKSILNRYGKKGVEALSAATPVDSGVTAQSWKYDIIENKDGISIVWSNENLNDGVNIAILLRYGHGTGTGGYVVGRDYISPAIQPVFEDMANSVWRELIK